MGAAKIEMKSQELRNLSADELEMKADEFRKELFNLRFQAKVGKLEKSSKIRMVKRDLARALTIRREWSEQKPKQETAVVKKEQKIAEKIVKNAKNDPKKKKEERVSKK